MTENEKNIKTLLLKMKIENEVFKEKIRLMRSQIEKLKELKKTVEVWENIK
jgi:hypothetical protein